MAIFGIQCKEDWFPGMWQRWYKAQCAAVGWPLQKLDGPADGGWGQCRNRLNEMMPGDWIVVQLKGRRIGRIGEVIRLEIGDDQWNPLVRPRKGLNRGEMGRRILLRWDLENAPPDPDIVVQLPENVWMPVRSTINRIYSLEIEDLKNIAADPENWVSLTKKFKWETELSDYIASFPHTLEDGLLPFPDNKVRERKFADGSRLDVLLEDPEGTPVVVECKQNPPGLEAISQLRGYMHHVAKETGQKPRGILCFGGARRVSPAVKAKAEEHGDIDLVHYRLVVNFSS